MDLTQLVGLVMDIGLGALAFNLARSLKANVNNNAEILAGVVKIQADHETRITALEIAPKKVGFINEQE